MTFTELIQKNVRKKDKNVKSISTCITDFEDITQRLSEIDSIHEADLQFHLQNTQKLEPDLKSPFSIKNGDPLKILHRSMLTTSMLFKPMGKIYKKICYLEHHDFFILSE